MKSSFLPFPFFPFLWRVANSLASHSWRANEVEKIKAAAGDH